LIDFAYDLDYEKFIDDMEVRQALALIKDRVQEIKETDDIEKRERAKEEQAARIEEIRSEIRRERAADAMSVASSQMSTKSRKEEILDEIRAEQKEKPEWDISQAGHEGK
jgi:hypothetical protein